MKKLLLKSLLLLCALVVGSANVWADYEELYSADFTTVASHSYTQNKTFTLASKSWKASVSQVNGGVFYLGCNANNADKGVLNNNNDFSSIVTALKNSDATYNTAFETAHAYALLFENSYSNVTKVRLDWAGGNNAFQVYLFGDSGSGWTLLSSKNYSTSGTSVAGNVEWTGSATNYTKFAIVARPGTTTAVASKTIKPTTFKIYKTVSVAPPTFSVAEGSYTSAQNVEIECTTDGATIYYTMGDNPANPTDASTPYTGAIEVNATTTIKAIAKKGSDYSAVSSATYTILTPITISAARTQATGEVYTQGVVTSVNGKNAYIQDNSAAIVVNSSSDLTVSVGDNIKVQGTLNTSHGLLRITTPTIEVVSQGNAVSPVVKTISEINTDYSGDNVLQGKLVTIENATVTNINGSNYTIAQSQNTIVVYGYMDVAVNDVLTLTGNIGCYDAVQIANPTNVTKHNPVINANNVTLACDATSGEIAYTIDNPTGATLTAALTNGDWISNIAVTSTKVTFTTTANEGTANRTATITLSYTGAADKVVTITQLYPITPCTLPFYWAGGASADLNALQGVLTDGLGSSDYGNSHNPYLIKFDNTGAYILIKTDCQPGTVSVGVKKIGGAGNSTITVQGSANGVDFNDVETLTIEGAQNAIVTLTTSNAFAASDRFVRLYFTKNANVGVGPISISLPEPAAPVVDDVNHTVTLTTSANMDGWRTFYPTKADQNYTADADVYYVSASGATTVTLTKIAEGVPANTPVILHKTSGTTITLTETATAITAPGASNLLAVSTANQNLGKVYRLGYKAANGIGFYTYTSASAPAGIIYVNNPSTAREFLGFAFGDDEATGVNEMKAQKVDGQFYDLQGRKVANPTKGLYIVNGKKVIIK